MTLSQHDKALQFEALHRRAQPFVIPNAWDGGSARLLAGLGFEAIATSSGASAGVLGRIDGMVTREESCAQARVICASTERPVSADLEKGFGDSPASVAETIRLAAAAGLVGGSIEDASGDAAHPIYDFDHAVERIAAAVQAARQLPFPFLLTARSENHLRGRNDLDDTIRRLQAFEKAGADVLYAPGLRDLETIRQVAAAVGKPLNVVMSAVDPELTAQHLAGVGVKRISVGGALSRLAFTAVRDAAIALRNGGSFQWVRDTMPTKDLQAIFSR
jgi:2-methylisocitrate lyase-like PEP mutase family enzyme